LDVPPGRLSFKTYGGDQGLLNLTPWALAQDGQGFIWVGTEDGLYRYDGQRFLAFGLKDGLPSAFVSQIHIDSEGTLWVGTYKGLSLYKNGRFEEMGAASGLPASEPSGIITGPDGQIWVGMKEGLFRRQMDGSFHAVEGWAAGAVTAMGSRFGSSTIWVASWKNARAAVWRWTPSGWKVAEGPKNFSDERIDALAADGRGNVWARSLRHLWEATPGSDRFDLAKPAIPIARQKGHLYIDPRGNLWVTTEQGLFRYAGGRWTRLGRGEGLPKNTVRAVMEDSEGSLWVASEGVFRLQGGGILQAYTLAQGLPNEVVWSIFRDQAGTLYVGTDSGLAKAAGGGWKLVPGTGNFQVRCIVQGPDGALYLTGGPQIMRVDLRGGVRRFGATEGVLTSGRIFRLVFDRQGALWAATDGGGLLKGARRGEQWRFERQSVPGGNPSERFEDLYLDRDGRVWAPGESGLAMWDGAAWHRFTTRDGLRNDHVSYVRGTQNGDLLLSYFDPFGLGRAVFSQGSFKVLEHLDQAFPRDKLIYSFGEDPKGNLWVGTGQGLDMLSRDGRLEHFGRSEGLVSEDTNAMALLAEANGDLWIGTTGGLARFDASAYRTAPRHPSTVLLECNLGKQGFPVFASERVQVLHSANTLHVKFAGLSFIREGSVQHQVKLEGLEKEWHFSETREERYPALPHGQYRFDARSRVGQGEWGPISSFEFEILPAWWETWWFRTLAVLAGAGAIIFIIRKRVEALHRRNQHLEAMVAARTREVEAKARELEEANEALRNQSLTDPLTGLRNRRYLGVCMPEDVAQVHRVHRDVIATRSDRVLLNIDLVFLMVDIDHFKVVNDQHGHSAGDQVLQQVAEILRKATRDSDTVVRWGGEEFLVVARNAARRESAILAERIRTQMAQHVFRLEDGTVLHRTCSVGFTYYPFVPEVPNLLTWEQVLDIADHCLYAAKRGGRDAWVGLYPTFEGDAQRIRAGMPGEIQALLESGDIATSSSLPDPSVLDWKM
jgi:diguanylate cyclase (GGDEF)-like protein